MVGTSKVPKSFTPQQVTPDFWAKFWPALGTATQNAAGDAWSSMINGLMAPGNALAGKYDQVEIGPDGSVSPFDPRMVNDASSLAGLVSLGSVGQVPEGALGMGIKRLPESHSLSSPPAPTLSDMTRSARIESVPLADVRGTQPKMEWAKFDSGDHPPPLIAGHGDLPVAVRKEDGEYLIFDGHHRAAKAIEQGQSSMKMHVIDAKDYAPQSAGRKPAPPTMSDEELLRALKT